MEEGARLLELQWTWGDNQRKTFFTFNSVETLTSFYEEHRGLSKLQGPLVWDRGAEDDQKRGKRWDHLQQRRLWSKYFSCNG